MQHVEEIKSEIVTTEKPTTEKKSLALIQKGDIDGLYEHNYKLLLYFVRKYNKYDCVPDYEEAMSMGNIAFMRALKTYDPDRGAFSTLLGLCVKQMFTHHYRSTRALKRQNSSIQSLSEPLFEGSDGKSLFIEDIAASDKEQVEEVIVKKTQVENYINYILEKTNGKRCVAVWQLTAQGITQEEIGRRLNISQIMVCRSLTRCKNYIKQYEEECKKECIKEHSTMAAKNKKVEQVKAFIQEGITSRKEIARLMSISVTSASTYLTLAKKELAKEKEAAEEAMMAPSLSVAVESEQGEPEIMESTELEEVKKAEDTKQEELLKKVDEILKKETPLAEQIEDTICNTVSTETIASLAPLEKEIEEEIPKKRRLKAKAITSDYFTYTFETGKISILQNATQKTECFNVDAMELHGLIEDLKELTEYI